jgi:cellulose 1,4-beta-cellobiosidase
MDIWEANSISGSYTAHPCSFDGQKACTGTDCGDNATNERYQGVCDKDGCDLNPYRVGVRDFYGPGSQFKVDTTRPFSVVTQFLTHDGTDTGELSEIKRLFIQDNKAIPHPASNTPGAQAYSSISDSMCDAFKTAFGDQNDFRKKGGLKQMGEALRRGMVLVMSLWDDHEADMLWLDSTSPPNSTRPGATRGSCPTSSGRPTDVES